MTIQIAICDDNDVDRNYVYQLTEKWAETKCLPISTKLFSSAEAFLFEYEENKAYDLLLLDIEMAKMDGVSMAKHIRQTNEAIQIVFITGYSDYILEGYEVQALHYLLKPLKEEKLFQILDRALAKIKTNEKPLLIEQNSGMVRIPLYEIAYLEVNQNYVTIHAKNTYTVKRTLSDFEKDLDERFYRVGRSYIVNLTYISRVSKKEIYLQEGSILPLPKGHYDALNKAIIARL